MNASRFDFVNDVVRVRDLVVTSSHPHACRVEPRESDLAWFCDLDDGYTTADDKDPPSSVRWVGPALRIRAPATGPEQPVIEVQRTGAQSDLTRLMRAVGRLARRGPDSTDAPRADTGLVYTDPAGILDGPLRSRMENWPPATSHDGLVRPAELWSVRVTREGLVVDSMSWWGSAPALDHQIGLAIDIARVLGANRQPRRQRRSARQPPPPTRTRGSRPR